jgi:hypothetical protein
MNLKKAVLMLVVIAALPTIFMACGNSPKVINIPGSAAAKAMQSFFRAANVFSQAPQAKQQSSVVGNPFLAYAQAPAAQVPSTTGNLSGFCSELPFDGRTVPVFGFGRWSDASCGTAPPPFDAGAGAPLAANVTSIGNFKVVFQGTGIGPDSGEMVVWINGNKTNLKLNLGLGSADGAPHTVEEKATGIAVNPATDLVQVLATTKLGDNYRNVRVLLGAQ